jgi:two-component system sensor histidine kinase KdpD
MTAAEPISHIRSEDLLGEPLPTERARVPGLGRRRQIAGAVVSIVGLALLTLLLTQTRDTFSLESQVLLYLLAVVIVGVVGGVAVALGSAIVAAFLINYFFVRPVHTLDVAQGE